MGVEMTKEEILAMEAGEELDRLVAAEGMGEPMPEFTPENALDLQLAGSPIKSPKGNWLCLCKYDEGDIPTWRPLPYSTDISAAWPVAEKMVSSGYAFCFDWASGKAATVIRCIFEESFSKAESEESEWIDGETASEVICKAALLVGLSRRK